MSAVLPGRVSRGVPVAVADVLASLHAPAGDHGRRAALPTGFDLLDQALDGGLRAHDLVLLGGAPGVGKTVAALQMARHLAAAGASVVYACYEHDTVALLGRLLCMEVAADATPDDRLRLEELRSQLLATVATGEPLGGLLEREPALARAAARLADCGDRLRLVAASGTATGLAELDALAGADCDVLVVDYLQKVAVQPEPAEETEKVTRITEGLKEISLRHDAAVVAAVAADRAGLEVRRLRPHHLRGSSALAYEADVLVLLNEKSKCVSNAHLAYDPVRADGYRHFVVFTIEKNRSGATAIDIEFRKDFASFRFVPRGSYVAERLVDERLDEA